MKFTSSLLKLVLIAAVAHFTNAQSIPTATQQLQLSVFVAATSTFTNLEGGKNLAITAGTDLTFLAFHRFKPSIEVRGTYPVEKGEISSQKNFLLGPRIEYPIRRFHPYVDFFVGRGKIDYHDPGFIFGNSIYLSSTTVVYSPGIGLDYDLTHNLTVKTDVQFQRWNTPATVSGAINPTAVTLGAVYNFDFNQHHNHRDR